MAQAVDSRPCSFKDSTINSLLKSRQGLITPSTVDINNLSHRLRALSTSESERNNNDKKQKSAESNEEEHLMYLSSPENEQRVNSKIWHLRAFVNYAKSYMMQIGIQTEDRGPKLGIDMGCYRGGDLKKWLHCNVDQLLMIENTSDECLDRYLFLRSNRPWFFAARFIKKDFSRENVLPDEPVHLISAQMSIHRAFESREQVKQMAYNISKSLRPGGKFVASFTSATKVLKKLSESPSKSSFGNSIYRVQFSSPLPETIPQFGVKFSFAIDENKYEEFLVLPEILKQELEAHGMKLIHHMPLKQWFNEAKKDENQVKAMERLDVARVVYIKKDKNNKDRKVFRLNLSSEEMEVVDMYDSVMFQKI